MTQVIKIDRDAFRRGVDDVMTLAPLRDAVRLAGSSLFEKFERSGTPGKKTPSSNCGLQKQDKPSDR